MIRRRTPEFTPGPSNPASELNCSDFVTGIDSALHADRLNEYMQARVIYLIDSSVPSDFVDSLGKLTDEFIHPDSVLAIRGYKNGVMLNDTEPYLLFGYKLAEDILDNPESTPIDQVLNSIQKTVDEYLGERHHEAVAQRDKILGKSVLRSKPKSIKRFKATGYGVCVERAALAHNLCVIGGISSIYVQGLVETGSGNCVNGHAFQVIEGESNRPFIYDTSMPSKIERNGLTTTEIGLFALPDNIFFTGESVAYGGIIFDTERARDFIPLVYSFNPTHPVRLEQSPAPSRVDMITADLASVVGIDSLSLRLIDQVSSTDHSR